MTGLWTGVSPSLFRGVPDESLPPAVLRALDTYLEESHCKLLILLPLRDEMEEKDKAPPRAALVLECFTTTLPIEQLRARLDVLAPHTASALANALCHREIPLRFLWQPLVWLQAGLGGKARAIVAAVAGALLALVLALVLVPYPLKMDAKGQLLPEQRRWIYAPVEGQVVRFEEGVVPGGQVVENQSLVLLYDVQLETKLTQLTQEVGAAQQDVDALTKQLGTATTEADRLRFSADKKQKEAVRDRKFGELRTLKARTHAEEGRPGHFWLKAPCSGTVLNWDFREMLTNRQVKPSEPLLRLGDKDRRWEVELKVPQKHMGQIVQAFAPLAQRRAGRGPAGRERADADVQRQAAAAQAGGRSQPQQGGPDRRRAGRPGVGAHRRAGHRSPRSYSAGAAGGRYRGPCQGALRRPGAGLFAVLRRLGVCLREGHLLVLNRRSARRRRCRGASESCC